MSPVTSTRTIDLGHPIPAPERGRAALSLWTSVCSSPTCTGRVLHLAVGVGDGDSQLTLPSEPPCLDLDLDAGTLTPSNALGEALLASEDGAMLREFARSERALLLVRDERLRASVQPRGAVLGRPAPEWTPGERMFHAALWPLDFDVAVALDGEGWLVKDAYCPDPLCPCDKWSLVAVRRDEREEADISRDGRVLEPAGSRAARIATQALANEPLAELFAVRRAEMDAARVHVVSAYYEEQRRRLRGGIGVVRNDALAELYAASAELLAAATSAASRYLDVRIRMSGSLELDVSVTLDDSLGDADEPRLTIELSSPDDETAPPIAMVDLTTRSFANLEACRARVASDLPLLHGVLVADAYVPAGDDHLRPARPQELRWLAAATRALARALPELDAFVLGKTVARDLELTIELGRDRVEVHLAYDEHSTGTGAAALRLGRAARAEEEAERGDREVGPVEPRARIDAAADDDDAPATLLDVLAGMRLEPALEAFADRGIDLGLSDDEIGAVHDVLPELDRIATRELRAPLREGWPRALEHYLRDRDDDLELSDILRGFAAFARWLDEMGHADVDVEATRTWSTEIRRTPRVTVSDRELILDLRQRTSSEPTTAPRPPRPDRWYPSDGEAIPGDKDACPCGSGRRYKKCCKPR